MALFGWRLALATAVFAFASTVPGWAQERPPAPAERLIDVSVNYNFQVPIAQDDAAAQSEVLERARGWVYRIAANECKVLQQTIATSCRLERLQVNANVQRGMPQMSMATVGANATYKVGVK